MTCPFARPFNRVFTTVTITSSSSREENNSYIRAGGGGDNGRDGLTRHNKRVQRGADVGRTLRGICILTRVRPKLYNITIAVTVARMYVI